MSQENQTSTEPLTSEKREMPEVEQELSKVAANPKQSMFILIGATIIFVYIFYTMFINTDDSKPKVDETPTPKEVTKPIESASEDSIPSIPTLPTPPKIEDAVLPPPPTPKDVVDPINTPAPLPTAPLDAAIVKPDASLALPAGDLAPNLPPTTNSSNDVKKARAEQKKRSSITLLAGTQPTKTPEQLQEESDFKYRGDLNLVLSRGKLLDAVVESAINTDFGGEIRGVITRDVYSEWGKNILIPKGSKIFGSYASGIDGSYGRIAITWERIDLINGYSINFSGNATDGLGRKGIQGRVDNKFVERFSNAVLRSAFNVALAQALDKVIPPQINSQQATSQGTEATSIRSIANSATAASEAEAALVREQVCANVLSAITDKASTAFTTITTACTTLRTQTGSTNQEKLTSLKATINSAADMLLQVTSQTSEPTKAQQASEQAFTDIADEIKSMVEEQELKPTITIDQGTHIKIYVNRDFRFPKAAVNKKRVLK